MPQTPVVREAPQSGRSSKLSVRLLRCLVVCPVVSAFAQATGRLSPQHLALPVGRNAGRRASGHFGQLARRGEIAGDARGVLHHRDQPHPPLATGASEKRGAWPWATSTASGVLVVLRDGREAYRYLSTVAGDHPPAQAVLAALPAVNRR